MTYDYAPTRLERLRSINGSIAKIDRVSAEVLARLKRHATMQEMAERQLAETGNMLNRFAQTN